jgi:predicted deacetylase
MTARYILRFDDICPTTNWGMWDRIEQLLVANGVRPIVAVVPDNRDKKLRVDSPNDAFWDRVRGWQSRGWAVGLHGYQHDLVSRDRGLFGWDAKSEFAGLPFDVQDGKIRRAIEIFRQQSVTPDVWVAPNHSFDRVTLRVLQRHHLSVVSDGVALFPYRDADGTLWIPMQLWALVPRSFGIWTVLYHPNHWGERDIVLFEATLPQYRSQMTDLQSVVGTYGDRAIGWEDRLFILQRRLRKWVQSSGIRLARVR